MRKPIPDKYLKKGKQYDARGVRFVWFFDRLPMQFETAEALELAEDLEIPERTVKRWLSSDKNIERIGHGVYKKTQNEL